MGEYQQKMVGAGVSRRMGAWLDAHGMAGRVLKWTVVGVRSPWSCMGLWWAGVQGGALIAFWGRLDSVRGAS